MVNFDGIYICVQTIHTHINDQNIREYIYIYIYIEPTFRMAGPREFGELFSFHLNVFFFIHLYLLRILLLSIDQCRPVAITLYHYDIIMALSSLLLILSLVP